MSEKSVRKQIYLTQANFKKVQELVDKNCLTYTGAVNHLINKQLKS